MMLTYLGWSPTFLTIKLTRSLLLVGMMILSSLALPQTIQAAIPRPDLKVTTVTSRFSSGSWYLVYTVKNIGSANTNAFYIKIKRGAVVEREFITSALAAGASRTFWQRMPICEFTRTILVDSRYQVVESSEANNTATFTNFC
jgi:hypothetical protein